MDVGKVSRHRPPPLSIRPRKSTLSSCDRDPEANQDEIANLHCTKIQGTDISSSGLQYAVLGAALCIFVGAVGGEDLVQWIEICQSRVRRCGAYSLHRSVRLPFLSPVKKKAHVHARYSGSNLSLLPYSRFTHPCS